MKFLHFAHQCAKPTAPILHAFDLNPKLSKALRRITCFLSRRKASRNRYVASVSRQILAWVLVVAGAEENVVLVRPLVCAI